MYNFTNSPYEKMMKQTPRSYRDPVAAPPPGSPCSRLHHLARDGLFGSMPQTEYTEKGG